jgi:hypothetical protein
MSPMLSPVESPILRPSPITARPTRLASALVVCLLATGCADPLSPAAAPEAPAAESGEVESGGFSRGYIGSQG